jgi:hypothetical protein
VPAVRVDLPLIHWGHSQVWNIVLYQLAKGLDIATIALWLGHERTQTTHIYEHADPALKEQAIARTAPLGTKPGRYRPSDPVLAWLQTL